MTPARQPIGGNLVPELHGASAVTQLVLIKDGTIQQCLAHCSEKRPTIGGSSESPATRAQFDQWILAETRLAPNTSNDKGDLRHANVEWCIIHLSMSPLSLPYPLH
jgi:hypothetical protein